MFYQVYLFQSIFILFTFFVKLIHSREYCFLKYADKYADGFIDGTHELSFTNSEGYCRISDASKANLEFESATQYGGVLESKTLGTSYAEHEGAHCIYSFKNGPQEGDFQNGTLTTTCAHGCKQNLQRFSDGHKYVCFYTLSIYGFQKIITNCGSKPLLFFFCFLYSFLIFCSLYYHLIVVEHRKQVYMYEQNV